MRRAKTKVTACLDCIGFTSTILFHFVEDIFCSFIIIFIFVVPGLHKRLGTGEWTYGRWVEALITWSSLKFILLKYSFGFSMSRFV